MTTKKNQDDPPWWYLLLAAIFMALSVYLYFYFTKWELEGGRRTINWVIALVYEIGGKWSVIALTQWMTWFSAYLAIIEFKKRRSWR